MPPSRIPRLLTTLLLACAVSIIAPQMKAFAQLRVEPGERPPFLSDSVEYLWPTNASPYLSGTFGETRSAHLHSGIDIKTWGQEGFDVYASRDGVLFRMQTGPSGYGNALYLLHEDGSFTVYAHLRNFIPALERIADSLRLPTYSHQMDERVDHLGIRFNRGERIAFTGSTGTGPPHLHFEIRSPDNIPWNPLLADLKVKDAIAPTIRSILIEELGPDGTPITSQLVRPSRARGVSGGTDSGTSPSLRPVSSASRIAISVDADDQADDVGNVYAVYRLELWKAGEKLFDSQIDAIPFETSGHLFVDRHYRQLRLRKKGFQRLHVMPGNRLPIYRAGPERGFMSLDPGRHEITLVAYDLLGNHARTDIFIMVEESEAGLATAGTAKGAAAGTAKGAAAGTAAADELAAPLQNETTSSIGSWIAAHGPSDMRMDRPAPRSPLSNTPGSFRIDTVLAPGLRHEVASPDQRVRLSIPSDALFDTLRLSVDGVLDGPVMWLRMDSEPMPFASAVRVHVHLQDTAMARDAGLRWGAPSTDPHSMAEPGRPISISKSGRHLVFRSTELGSFELYRDARAPELSQPFAARTLAGSPSMGIRVSDESPLDLPSAVFTIDGQRGIPLFEPDRRTFVYHHPEGRPRSARTISFEIADVTGNKSAMTWVRNRAGGFDRVQ